MEKCVKMVDGKFNNKCDNTCIRTPSTCQKKCPVSTSEGLNDPGPPRWGMERIPIYNDMNIGKLTSLEEVSSNSGTPKRLS